MSFQFHLLEQGILQQPAAWTLDNFVFEPQTLNPLMREKDDSESCVPTPKRASIIGESSGIR